MSEKPSLIIQAKALQAAAEAFRGLGGMTVVRQPASGPPTASVSGYDKVLLVEAGRSASRAQAASVAKDALTEAGSSVAAILCAAAACETWLSEYLGRHEALIGLPVELESIRSQWDATAQWRDLLRIRAPSFALGNSREYQALGCLFRLRDHIAHRNAHVRAVGTFPARLEDCVRQGTLPIRAEDGADWTSAMFVSEVARWAYEAGKNWINEAQRVIPEPGFAAG